MLHRRHERREFTFAFGFPHFHSTTEHRNRRPENWQPVPGRSGRFGKGWQDRCFWSDTRGGQEDQQVTLCTWNGHQCSHGREGAHESAPSSKSNHTDKHQAKHIPYRDSKLTRILQESLGGNSRTTLIINCSPSSYNEPETLSTLRFGIRAKSIKNTARVNAELSPTELKGLLSKANVANGKYKTYIESLEAELAIWRSGGQIAQADWVSSDKPLSAAAKKPPTPAPSTPRSATPVNPLIEGLRGDLESRPQTPTVLGLEKDERDDFLKRENELGDQLGLKESALIAADKLVTELREELTFLKEQESTVSKAGPSFMC